jgi:hypothetical protein
MAYKHLEAIVVSRIIRYVSYRQEAQAGSDTADRPPLRAREFIIEF